MHASGGYRSTAYCFVEATKFLGTYVEPRLCGLTTLAMETTHIDHEYVCTYLSAA